MPGTYSNLLYHIIFSTKGRAAMLKDETQHRVHEYLGGIVRGEGGVAYQIGGMPDHVHLLVRWRTDESLATLLRKIKSNSSRWIHEMFPMMASFAWQEGYSAFTVSQSQKDSVAHYTRIRSSITEGRIFKMNWSSYSRPIKLNTTPDICGIESGPNDPSPLPG